MRPRRRAAIAAGVAGGVLGVGALGAWLALPSIVRDEAIARVERRTGLRCTIGDVDVGLTEVVLHGVSLRDEDGTVELEIESVSVDAGALGLASSGLEAATRIAIAGGDWRLAAGGEGVRSLIARLRGERGERSEGAPESDAGSGRLPAIVAVDVAVAISDEHGELVRAAAIGLQLDGDRVVIDARGVAIAPGTAESTSIDEIHVEALRGDRRLESARARGVRVEIADAHGEAPGVMARARALRSSIVGEGEDPGGDAADAEGEPAGAGAFRWLGDRFAAQIDGLSLRRATPDGPRDVLSELDISLERISEGAVRTRGQGRPDGGGELRWDLRLEPIALRAEGSIDLDGVALAVVEPLLPEALPLHRPEDARLSGSLRIEGHGEALQSEGRLTVRELALSHPRIAPQPIQGIAFGAQGRATFYPAQRRLEIASLRLEAGAAHADLSGAIEWAPEHYLFDLEASLPATPCNDAIGAIPHDLLQEMAVLSMSGTIGGRIQLRLDSRDLDATQLVIRVSDRCRFEMVPPIADLSRFDGPFVHRVEEPDGTIFEMETGPGTDSWVPIGSISPFFVHAVLGHEDGGFFRHEGFSPFSIREALVRNLRAGRYVMGASTISMQLVKNVFLHREKTLARKVQEVLLTWWIESAWPKDRILELYLNVIEYGPGVYGIRNASRHYFGIEPADLSPAQAAYLANVLPNPKLYHGHYVAGAVPASWVNRVSRFLRLMGERGRYDAAAVDEGLTEIASLRFHRPGEPAPAPRTFHGRTGPLPIEAVELGLVEAQWDDLDLPGPLAGGDEPVDAPDAREYE